MKLKTLISLVAIAAVFNWQAEAQTYDTNNVVVQTFAGSGFYGYLDGVGQSTMFYNPLGVVADSSDNLFVADNGNYRIRKITPDGTVSTFAGGGDAAPPGYGTNVSLNPARMEKAKRPGALSERTPRRTFAFTQHTNTKPNKAPKAILDAP